MAEWIPAQGYCFDGTLFQRATTNVRGLVINKETKQRIDVQPSMLVWYTRREMTNALALYAQRYKQTPELVVVAPSPELMGILKEQGAKPMLTKEHLYRMLTNGLTRVLGRPLTEQEKDGYEKKATLMAERLDAAQVEAQRKEAKIA